MSNKLQFVVGFDKLKLVGQPKEHHSRTVKPILALALVLLISQIAVAQSSDWAQWGGPQRNFKSDTKGLATTWPAAGPRRLWERELGEGYSAIAAERGMLFTMYRKGENEIVIALDAATGKTVWEYSYAAPFSPEYDMSYGTGPHATPLVVGNLLFTSGATGKLHCLDKKSGKLLWSHDLIKEFHGTVRVNGYSCSPIAYKDKIVMLVGGQASSLVAFNQKDGTVAWKKHDFRNSTSSPIIINVDGQDQLVAFMYAEVVGVDPNNGNLLWSHPHPVDFGLNTSTPVWGSDNLLFISSGYNGGSRVIKLSRSGDKTTVEELWSHRLMRIHFTNAIRVGDFVYGSSGDFGPAPFTAVDVKTGKVLWRHRSFPRASFIFADGRFIILDEDGNLILATVTAEGLTVTSKVQLLSQSWTVPSLAGTRLYLRDRKKIMALEIGTS
ncbi:MAG TPA: PQQ-binding-like beta-propeller repeat protein [Pyrinomonadaceae bacterium]|nr:PQQ-binding-like beta-propeller repeat protein [Pyrinomonadaceae bacterium]